MWFRRWTFECLLQKSPAVLQSCQSLQSHLIKSSQKASDRSNRTPAISWTAVFHQDLTLWSNASWDWTGWYMPCLCSVAGMMIEAKRSLIITLNQIRPYDSWPIITQTYCNMILRDFARNLVCFLIAAAHLSLHPWSVPFHLRVKVVVMFLRRGLYPDGTPQSCTIPPCHPAHILPMPRGKWKRDVQENKNKQNKLTNQQKA